MKLFLLFVIIGLASADYVRDGLLKKLDTAQHQLNDAVTKYKSHGFDYFAEILQKFVPQVLDTLSKVTKLSEFANEIEAANEVKEVEEIEKQVPGLVQYPAIHEIYKAGALYLAVMKIAQNESTDPKPESLRKQVADIVIQERFIKTLQSSDDVAERQQKSHQLSAMYDVLFNNIHGAGIPTQENFDKLEVEAKKQLSNLLSHGKHDEAQKIEDILNKFLTSTYYIAKYFPLDSQTRVNQLTKAAPEHFKAYKALNSLILL